MTEKKNFTITIEPDYDKLNAWGIKGRNMKEIKESCDELLTPKHTEKWYAEREMYTLLGKSFMVCHRASELALLTAGNDIRFPQFDVHDVPSLFKAGIEWLFKRQLNGKKMDASMWPEVEGYMKDQLDVDKMPWNGIKKDWFGEADKNEYNEIDLLTAFAEELLYEIADIECYY